MLQDRPSVMICYASIKIRDLSVEGSIARFGSWPIEVSLLRKIGAEGNGSMKNYVTS